MKPVDQTAFGFPGGNCFSACVASLLEIQLAEVPYFMGDNLEDDGGAWYRRFEEWLAPRGFYPVAFSIGSEWRPAGFHILSGKSPRDLKGGALHSVVARGDEIVHDPHPSRAGLLSREDVIMLVPLDPASVAQRLPIGRAPAELDDEMRARLREMQSGPLTLAEVGR